MLRKKPLIRLVLSPIALVFIIALQTANARDFSEASISYLNGKNFKVEPAKQQTFTFEYVYAKDWFDLFLFIDNKDYQPSGSNRYGEITPRFTIHTFEQQSTLKRLTFAMLLERGKNGIERNLFGVGVDLNIQGFRYFNVHLYQRDDPDIAGSGNQITTTFAYPFNIGEAPLLFDGYFDWVLNSDEQSDNFHFNPQLKLDMKAMLEGEYKWYIGIEYDYWTNKFGIRDTNNFPTNQNTWSFLVKWHF
ncbi:hypothetical protein FLL45_15225 [Aliikangiella marina]|uniref:DUF5020 family protein n=1 Tax=Aliikangiella marina TaxID=1712262 RepID=A0A545T6G8_9GAMM|nr:hypothetical protein [Aliikangiella marina]TQV72819.1 hypothetical protein FLL45_15225 [Aliikangiella marina]